MTKTAAERQKEYRARRQFAGEDGNGERRITAYVSTRAALALRRLANSYGVTQRDLLERLLVTEEEKALKGFLHFHKREFPKTHDLRALVPRCIEIEAGFVALDPDAEHLTPLATSFRYPDDYVPLNPTRAEFDEALAAAQRVYDFVLSQLPAETHPT